MSEASRFADVLRDFAASPAQTEMLQAGLTALAAELEADAALSSAEQQAKQRQEAAELRRLIVGLKRLVTAIELLRPPHADAVRRILAHDLGRLLSTAAPGLLLDQPIDTTVSSHAPTSRAAELRGGLYTALEQEMVGRRQMVARGRGDELLAAFLVRLASRLQEELDFERPNRSGRPIDRPRRLALFRLLQLFESLTGRPVSRQPSERFRSFAAAGLAALGLDLAGLDPALDRLFRDLRKVRQTAPS